MSTTADTPKRERLLRIGEVVRRLRDEFPDISISKIRYLEDEGLLTPRADARRLPALQRGRRRASRDDPAAAARRVPAAAGDPRGARRAGRERSASADGRPGVGERVESIDLDELCRRSGITPELAKELEEFGLLASTGSGADKRYPETDADVAGVCAQLSRYGVAPRHLRTFSTATDRETALLEQLVAPALRARNAERRAAGARTTSSRSASSRRSSRRCSSGATCGRWHE